MSRPGATGWKLIRSTLGHDGRGGLALTLADAGAASNAYRNESRDQSDEYFFHWNSPLFHATRCTLRASLHRWSPAEANGSPAPETVGHFKGDCVLGDTVTRRAQQNLPVSGSRSAPRHPPLPVYFRVEFEGRRLRQGKLRPANSCADMTIRKLCPQDVPTFN